MNLACYIFRNTLNCFSESSQRTPRGGGSSSSASASRFLLEDFYWQTLRSTLPNLVPRPVLPVEFYQQISTRRPRTLSQISFVPRFCQQISTSRFLSRFLLGDHAHSPKSRSFRTRGPLVLGARARRIVDCELSTEVRLPGRANDDGQQAFGCRQLSFGGQYLRFLELDACAMLRSSAVSKLISSWRRLFVCLFVYLFIPFNVLCKSKTIVGRLEH